MIFVSAIDPLVERLTGWKFPKALAIALIYVLVILVLAGIATLGLQPVISQTSSLIEHLNQTVAQLGQGAYGFSLKDQLPNLSGNILTYTIDILKSFITAVLVAVITFYMLLDKDNIEMRFAKLFGSHQAKPKNLLRQTEIKLGAWLRGQLLLSLMVAVLIYIGLVILGVDFALPLAIISGLLEVVPIIGPIISAIPAILVALITSPVLALIVAGWYLVVQQAESHVIVPQVMKRAVGLNPLVVILAIAIGDRLLGISGALLAVPIAVVIQIIADDYFNGNKEEAKV